MYETILTERRGHIGVVTLNRPKLHNAFNDVLVAELNSVFEAAEHDESLHALVLTGAGPSFCAGADTHWMRGMANASQLDNREDSLKLARLMRRLNFLDMPTIARVNGSAYGGGIGLIACCDIAIGTDDAKFALSEVKLGLVPAVISPYVVDAIGLRQARRLFVTGEVFGAEHAVDIGLLHEHVAAEQLDARVLELVKRLQKAGPLARRNAKRLALRVAGRSEPEQVKQDTENADLIARLRVSDEGQEGLGAFLDKRKPDWVEESNVEDACKEPS
ncbi:MAG TPA: enoyl-CoA hydratase/isomerase family protein [Oleiagrimonas sp.]|nr:enoyl-CoA hydratase/isomerase family protein [Oleiagrimonas sp.]